MYHLFFILGTRNISREHVANLGKQVGAAGVIKNKIEIGGVDPNFTCAVDDTFTNDQINGIRGVPIDKIIIYACGKKD
jgi:hypothetical protein